MRPTVRHCDTERSEGEAIPSLLAVIFILLSLARFSFAELSPLESVQATLDKEEVSVEYSEANSDELQGDLEAAKVHYRKIISYYTNIYNDSNSNYLAKLPAVREIGMLKIKCEDYQEAVDLLKGFLAQYPDNKPVSNTLAEALYFQAMDYVCKRDEFQKAVDNVNEILNMPNIDANWQPQMKFYMASLYQGKGKYDEALEWYNKIIQEHPDCINWIVSAHLSIAEYYIKIEGYAKAKEHLKIILNDYPSSSYLDQANQLLKEIPAE